MFSNPLTGRHVFFILLGFFGVMFAVNIVFVTMAVKTFHGVDNPTAYRDGVAYNERVAAAERQRQLRWSETIELTPGADKLEIRLTSQSGIGISELVLEGLLARPTGKLEDVALQFRGVSPGLYVAQFPGLRSGQWIATVQAARMTGETPESKKIVYRMRKRLWVKPAK